jgi:aminobenzoyl-glutamate utilization protein B
MLINDDEAEAEDAPSGRTRDFESILTLAPARGTPERMLRWHYRSRHPSLIALSNHACYAGSLLLHLIRASDLPELTRLVERVRKIAQGAALMTETRMESQVVSAVSNLLANAPLEKAMYDHLVRLGPPPFDEADRAQAAKFQSTLTDEDLASAFRRAGLPMRQGVPLCDQIVPLDAKSAPMLGSTDVGDVSWVVPTVQARGTTYAIGTPGHSWQLTAQGKLPAAHKGLAHVAKVMAGTAIEVIQDEVLLARAKADHQARVSRNPYVCPLPDDLEPPVKMSA